MCSNTELKDIITEQGKAFSAHVEDEMEGQKEIRQILHDINERQNELFHHHRQRAEWAARIDKRLSNGVQSFQQLAINDQKADDRIDSVIQKVSELGCAVDKNADGIMKSRADIKRLTAAIESLAKGLAPILEVMHKFTAAMPFFEMIGKATTWVIEKIAPILAVIAAIWAYVSEPWRYFSDFWKH